MITITYAYFNKGHLFKHTLSYDEKMDQLVASPPDQTDSIVVAILRPLLDAIRAFDINLFAPAWEQYTEHLVVSRINNRRDARFEKLRCERKVRAINTTLASLFPSDADEPLFGKETRREQSVPLFMAIKQLVSMPPAELTQNKAFDFIRFLVRELHADINWVMETLEYSTTPMMYLIDLTDSLENDDDERCRAIVLLLVELGATIKKTGRTREAWSCPLAFSVANGMPVCFHTLLDQDARFFAVSDIERQYPLHSALKHRRKSIFSALLRHHERLLLDFDSTPSDYRGNTLLHCAISLWNMDDVGESEYFCLKKTNPVEEDFAMLQELIQTVDISLLKRHLDFHNNDGMTPTKMLRDQILPRLVKFQKKTQREIGLIESSTFYLHRNALATLRTELSFIEKDIDYVFRCLDVIVKIDGDEEFHHRLAFAMSQSARLGAQSVAHGLPPEVLEGGGIF